LTIRSPFSHLTPKSQPLSTPPAGKSATPPVPVAIALQGNIAAIALDNIFQLFDFAALTGKLEVHTPENIGNFYFMQGVLTYGMLQIHQRKIGEILLESKMITPVQLQECLRLHAQGRFQRRFGQIVLEQGFIEPSGLDESLLRQIKEAFFEALSWQEGTFAFYPDQFPAPETVQLQARVDHLLLEGMVYIDNTCLPNP
jgi:hypothetical protein